MAKKKTVDVREYEPGLGCPHCKHEGFYTEPERTTHIRKKHPGQYSGPTDDMMMVKDRIKQIHRDRREG